MTIGEPSASAWGRRVRGLACASVMSLALLAPSAARAADPKVQQDLEQAEQGLVNLDYDNANKLASRVVAQRGLSHDQLVRVYRVLALTNAVLDKEQASRDAFTLLLTYDPTYAGDANLGPRVQAPFMEARGYLRAQAVQPGVEAQVVLRPTEPGTIRVTTRDPTHLGRKLMVGYRWGGDGPFTAAQLPIGEGSSTEVPPPPAGISRLDYYVQVLDDHDSAAFEVGNPSVPKSATVDLSGGGGGGPAPEESHSVFASPWFWLVAGVVVAGTTTGVILATHKSTTTETLPPTGASLGPSLTCGATKCSF